MKTTTNAEIIDFNKVWLMFQETDRKFQETDRQFKETKDQLQKTKELLDSKFQETRNILDSKFQETDKQIKETDRIVRNLSKKMSEVESRWGKFVEALVEGALVRILNDAGIPVNRTAMREKCFYKDEEYEIDIIAKNGDEIVVVEVKTTLGVSDVNNFIEKLEIFKEAFPEYKNNKIYGAVAYINKESESDKFAAKNGLIVIKAVGESAKITNRKNFKPKSW